MPLNGHDLQKEFENNDEILHEKYQNNKKDCLVGGGLSESGSTSP